MENSRIPWTHHTQNWWIGCTKVSPGCDICYAEFQQDHRYHRVEWGDHPRHRTAPSNWKKPFTWNRAAKAAGVRQRVFTNSLSDFFDNQVDPAMRMEAWDIMRQCDWLIWLILTKRPQNIRKMLPPDWCDGWPNVWLGTTTENLEEARRRIPVLLRIPAVIHYISGEPMLERLDLRPWLGKGMIAWVICGGESGGARREMDPAWAYDLCDQCADSGTAFFMKQMSAHQPHQGELLIPADLMIRQFPE
jgi:protein gp37